MKKLSIAAALLALPCWAGAQQQQTTPGMEMSGQPQQQNQQNQQQSMPDMNIQSPPAMQMPKDMRVPPDGQQGPAAARETESMRNSEQQQHGQSGVKPGPESDAQSATHATMTLQEPENPDYHTGSDLPAPELLGAVAKRAPLTLGDFESWATRLNPTLAQANTLVRRSEQQGRQVSLWPNPAAGYQGEQIRGGSYGGGEQGGYVQQTIVLGGKLGLRRNIYEQEKATNLVGVEEQKYRVQNDVQQAFYAALTSQSTVVVRQRLLRLALDAVETAHQLGNVGQADAPDILQAEVEADQAKIDFLSAQRQYLQDFTTLTAVSGKPDERASPLNGDLDHPPELNTEQQVALIVANSPEVKFAQQRVALAQARIRDARREPVPDLLLRAGEQYNGEQVATQPVVKAVGPQSFATANINIPLWNHNQGNIAAARAELENAQQDVVRTRLDLKQVSEMLAQSYLTARFTADRYRTQLIPRARRAYELYLMKYQQMAEAYPQVLVSQRTLFQLQIGYLQALHGEWATAVALKNFTLAGGLMQPMSVGANTTTLNLPNGGGSE